MDPSKIREKIGRFRILVVGRANAGKTTILQRVCNTRDDPEIHNSSGKKIELAVIEASRERGLHDINNEMVFRSNQGFIFHDSRGFESGGEAEFIKVKGFIADRSKEKKITNRLHTIWYCIPMDEAHRSFTAAEQKFFSECDTGTIPVIVVFTKFDALYDVAYTQLKKEGKSLKDARELAPKRAEETFPDGPQLKFLKGVKWPPKGHVCLPNMNEDNADCGALIECTAATLNNEMLEQLFVSTQQTNLEICMRYAIEKTLPTHLDSAKRTTEAYKEIVGTLGSWFPHIWDDLRDDHCAVIQSKLLSVASSSSSPLENIVQLISAAVIIFEHSFYIFEKRPYLQDRQNSDPSFYVALEQYMPSPHASAVREGVSVAVHTFQERSSPWKVKPLFGRFQIGKKSIRDSQKMELVNTIVKIALEHRLSRPQHQAMQHNIDGVPK